MVRPDIGQRLAESFETALNLAEGIAVIEYADAPAAAAEECHRQEDRKDPRQERAGTHPLFRKVRLPGLRLHHSRRSSRGLFSFNNPYGACPACDGLGIELHFDEDLVVPDQDLTLRKGAIAPWAKSSSPYYLPDAGGAGKYYKFTLDTPWKELPKKTQNVILHGSGEDKIKFSL